MAELGRILLVDDSRVFLSVLRTALSEIPGIEVIGSAPDGETAVNLFRTLKPNLVTLDVEMPGMGGMAALEVMHQQNLTRPKHEQTGIIMVSSLTGWGASTTVRALQAGAFDFITKPNFPNPEENIRQLRQQLQTKIRLFLLQRAPGNSPTTVAPPKPLPSIPPRAIEIVVVAASTGGPRALEQFLPEFSRRCRQPIFIVQHLPASFTASLAENLNRICARPVMEATNGTPVDPQGIYIAPGGFHLLLRREGTQLVTVLNQHPPENLCRPAADVLFRSAASVCDGRVLAIVLTGMGNDGTRGASTIKRAGGVILVQDEASSIVWGMPGSIASAGGADAVVPIGEMATFAGRLLTDSEGFR
ncbi:protein-glutamate methylesterase/protein-glutamine glutaminase [Tuwongella immobilis]|uniref:Protein-glutamate methylesterase/protein-glutamine glutaminase n=1 Tax=Tuwongella immobilis TaxID=692036 RepID=A0A6C2YMA0_9BACT|nr:chemotaxis response regulator protein-glutamate methylesterase [Tuwongella immobilis]VIP02253.1 chemotaxis protein : Chemotaxis response regulator protein-glutamate methylesterase OS=Thermodesulfatator indicus (strain DSM 15286 / JCM 11887 / CIR29812) GN=cheB PE=3 SV=1: Response_reg: CheB_methylest [Tuwongella immobilis]VTS00846.1 chemotaxis protein : Chemotaxis response regulator protein-glutamate methylesterase OS=Thermodesulfatator indicus (strain DSM 15286 / JCM 11887 / CIR29812) GN=cheB P